MTDSAVFIAKDVLFTFFLFIIAGASTYIFILVYHLIRFGIGSGPKKAAAVFLIGSVIFMLTIFSTYIAIDTGKIKQGVNIFLPHASQINP